MGYSADDWSRLERDIREQHLVRLPNRGSPRHLAASMLLRQHCRGRTDRRQVTSVWIIRPSREEAELVTIEPAARKG